MKATKELAKAILLRRGMNLKEVRGFMLGRYGIGFQLTEDILKELLKAGIITSPHPGSFEYAR